MDIEYSGSSVESEEPVAVVLLRDATESKLPETVFIEINNADGSWETGRSEGRQAFSTPVRIGNRPVKSVDRLGEQSGIAQVFMKRTPPRAIASSVGVRAGFIPFGSPVFRS